MLARADIQHLPIADNSIDLIFTDPPYAREYLPLYGYLAQEAARVLKPGGFVIAMAGNLYLNQIYRQFDVSGLQYFYNFYHDSGNNAGAVWVQANGGAVRITTPIKQFVCYSKGKATPRARMIIGRYSPGFREKNYHHWGQDCDSATYYIEAFSKPGDLILDPFIGGGTTLVACELIGRRCIGMDIDPAALTTSADRIANAGIMKQGLFAGMTI